MTNIIKKYGHGALMTGYGILYILIFRYLENRPVHGYHVIHTIFDDMIPFCEFFIIPYFLWFFYIVGTVAYFIFINKNKREYYQLSYNLIMGMSIFLVVSYLYPNIQHLRPAVFPRENILTDLVRRLYSTDTPTNILPSIHVFNSLAVHMAISTCEALREKKAIRYGSLVLCILIILSTMFLKQHSVIDVCLGCTLALFGAVLFYPEQAPENARNTAWNTRRQNSRSSSEA